MGTQATSTGSSAINAGIGMYSAYQEGKRNQYNIKREAALQKAALLKEYRETMATNLAQQAASGFTQSGNLSQVNNANTLTLTSDINEIDSQSNSQIKLAKLGSRGQMSSILSSSLGKEVSNYTTKKAKFDKIGNGEEFSYFK